MRKPALLLLALLPLLAPAAAIQRRSPSEVAAGVPEPVGGLTYSAAPDGSATLRVGTSDAGTLFVSDPWAVHVAPTRLLAPSEYSVVLSNATWTADGRICMASNVVTTAYVGARAEIGLLDPTLAISAVTFDADANAGHARPVRISDGRVDIVGSTTTGAIGGIGDPGHLYISNISVRVWTTSRRSASWNAVDDDVALLDDMGEVPVSGLRRWVAARYDGRTAEDWSNHPATNRVQLAGQPLWFTPGGSLRAAAAATNTEWRIVSSGVPVVRILAEQGGGASEDLAIRGIEIDGGTVRIWVGAALGSPVRIQASATLTPADWIDADGAVSTYPAAEVHGGYSCYRVDVPLDPSAPSCFYRAVATGTGGSTRALRLCDSDAALYVGGVRVAWTNITIGGQTLRVLAAQPD